MIGGVQTPGMEFHPIEGLTDSRRYFDYLVDEFGVATNGWWMAQHVKSGQPFLPCFTRATGDQWRVVPATAAAEAEWVNAVWDRISMLPRGTKVQSVPVEIWNEPNAMSGNDPGCHALLVKGLIAKARQAKRSDLCFLGPAVATEIVAKPYEYVDRYLASFSKADLAWLGLSFHFYPNPNWSRAAMMLALNLYVKRMPAARCYITELGVGKLSATEDPIDAQAVEAIGRAVSAIKVVGIPLAHCWAWIDDQSWMKSTGPYFEAIKGTK